MRRDIDSVDCKGRLSEQKNMIATGLSTVQNYLNSTDIDQQPLSLKVLSDSIIHIKAALHYIIASTKAHSRDDLSACPIVKIVRDGDSSSNYLVGSDLAIASIATIMQNHVLVGTMALSMIYEVQLGKEKAA